MQSELSPGLTHTMVYEVPENKTVPHLLPEAFEFAQMPHVLATGYMVGLIEWTCIQAINPHIDWPRQQSVGIGINVTHEAPTPPGMTVTIDVRLESVDGRKLTFQIEAHDDTELIARGSHDRFIIDFERFDARLKKKIEEA